ncbi:MAG: hypothetical protein O7G87_19105 [bacterium]|nr:hypothetical protein [bacterium]
MKQQAKSVEENVQECKTHLQDRTENVEIPTEWLEDFEAAARRPLETRMRYAFIQTYKPVLDDVPYRAFDTMEDYRQWCETHLPEWLGYGRV